MKRNGCKGTCEEDGLKGKILSGIANEDWVNSEG